MRESRRRTEDIATAAGQSGVVYSNQAHMLLERMAETEREILAPIVTEVLAVINAEPTADPEAARRLRTWQR